MQTSDPLTSQNMLQDSMISFIQQVRQQAKKEQADPY